MRQHGEASTGTLASIGMMAFFLLVGVIVAGMWGCPQYNVYEQRLNGEAILSKAESTRRALVVQAQAEKDAATLRAEAIKIVGQAAKDFPEYRQQEFIGAFADALQNGKVNQIIYVPTEASIPIVEARRPLVTEKK